MSTTVTTPTISGLAPAQQQIVQALAQGSTITAAAAAIGVHRATIYRWLSDDHFQQAVRAAHADYVLALRDQLKELSSLALSALYKLLTKPEISDTVLLRTSLAVLARPRFPRAAWTLPDKTGPLDEDKLRKDLLMMELDLKGKLDQATVDKAYDEF
jgi:hypothetical protein